MSELAQKSCVPCEGGVPPLKAEQIEGLLAKLGADWAVKDQHHLEKLYTFDDFMSGLGFVNRVAEIAEAEAHHPDIYLAWGKVRVTIWTHKIDGLTESDFVLAAKIEQARPA